ncbi:MAG: TetR/AcrR family transcriptional regulator [Acidimicrobiia bacterium]
MARPAQFSTAAILDAARARVVEDGPGATTIAAIAAEVGAPTGSLYHRFPSRDVLLATLWLDTVERFQAGYLAAISEPDVRAAVRRARTFFFSWCREHLTEARLLLLHRREDLLRGDWPPEVRDRAAAVTRDFDAGLRAFARRAFGSTDDVALRRARFAVVDLLFAGARGYLAAGTPPPPDVEALVQEAADAVMKGT